MINIERMVVALGGFLCAATVLIIGLNLYSDELNEQRMERLLDAGHHPMEVACMMNPGSYNLQIHCYELTRNRDEQ